MDTQFKKGILEICVLKVVSEKDSCGFEVIERISKEFSVNENTIYPILRRLTTQEYFETYKVPSPVGAPKKYYKITDSGKDKLSEYLEEWKLFIKGVFRILEGGRRK